MSECITEQQVRRIRALRYVASQRDIAGIFGIDQTLVSMIQLRKAWAHVE